jgi:hypothetical protein
LRNVISLTRWSYQLKDMLCIVQPKLIFSQEEGDPFGPITAALAQEFGCQVFNFFSGILHKDEPHLQPPNFDGFILWGPYQKEMFMRYGVESKRLFTVGHNQQHAWLATRDKRLARTNKQSAKQLVVYFSQPPVIQLSDFREAISNLLKAALQGSDRLALCIKLHPNETDGMITKLWHGWPGVEIGRNDLDRQELIVRADLVVGCNSTALLEAFTAGVPAALYDTSNLYEDFVNAGAAIDLRNSKNPATELIAVCLDDERLHKMSQAALQAITRHFDPNAKDATKLVAHHLERILS